MKKLADLSLEELWNLFPIILDDYKLEYEEYFKEEYENLKVILSGYSITRISHIGSTAIKGIKSKPIVDILIEIDDLNEIEKIKDILLNNNWLCMSECTNPFKYSFNKGYTINGYEKKVYHVHIKRTGDCDEIYFRDYLNQHESVRKEYELLKISLLNKYKKNRDAYTNAKSDFVQKYSCLGKNLIVIGVKI